MSFQVFIRSVFRIFLLYLVVLITFFLFRLSLLFAFGDAHELHDYHHDLYRAFLTGLRYDTVVFNYAFLVLFLIACIPLKSKWYTNGFNETFFWYSMVVSFIMIVLQIGDFYFFKFFQSHFNLLVFGIIYDDTKAVLESVWTDYPVIRIILGFLLGFGLLGWLIRRISRLEFPRHLQTKPWQSALAVVIIIGLYALGLRGSLGIFPIEKDDATISPNGFVNSLTMNGVFALKDAYADHKRNKIETDTSVILHKYGFTSKQEALQYFTGSEPHVKSISEALIDTTPHSDFLLKSPPHVLFILMESLGDYYFDLHSDELNLLGSLEQELPYCIVFRNFTSCTNGTIHTIEGLLVSSPLTPLSQSVYMNTPLHSSVARVFADNGYQTGFITGAKLGWRNLGKYMTCQFFQQVEGSSHLIKEIPGAQGCEWGIFDEYLFERIFQVLQESSDAPLFVFAFTTTNHTPYQLPGHYQPKPVILSDDSKYLQRYDKEVVIKNFTAYQYANDCLGKLLHKIRNSSLGQHTIVAVTGDHNSMALYDFPDRELHKKYGVPFILYIPDAYKPFFTDASRYGSHKDIFPTLFNLALSDAAYVKSGNNLFEKGNNDQFFAINSYNTAFNKAGGVVLGKRPLYSRFENEKYLVPATPDRNPELERLEKMARAHGAVLSLFIQEQLSK